MKKKTTKHVIGDVYTKIWDWKHKLALNGVVVSVFEIIFSNEGSKGREPLFDISKSQTGDIFAYWKDEKNGILEISAPDPGYEIRAPKSMQAFFSSYPRRRSFIAPEIHFLDVSHLDVSKTDTFSDCFKGFGAGVNSKIIGLENWDVGNGIDFRGFFCDAFPFNDTVSLDLSSWKFTVNGGIFTYWFFKDFAPAASTVELHLEWDTSSFARISRMFHNFAVQAKDVSVTGIENWNVEYVKCFDYMFENFAPQSNCKLDLTGWSKKKPLYGEHNAFAKNVFFRIKEPVWAN